nr:MAG TPA: hypothetical protein [Caudoviricetes sp.]
MPPVPTETTADTATRREFRNPSLAKVLRTGLPFYWFSRIFQPLQVSPSRYFGGVLSCCDAVDVAVYLTVPCAW